MTRPGLLAAPLSLSVSQALAQPADLIVTNARICTVDGNRPVVDAMAIRGGRVVFTGPGRLALTMRGPATQVLNLSGRTVIPGVIDAHVHLLNPGHSLRNVDLAGTTSCDDVIARGAARSKDVPAATYSGGRAVYQKPVP
jgi:predicted amidohydrolase YtcJ